MKKIFYVGFLIFLPIWLLTYFIIDFYEPIWLAATLGSLAIALTAGNYELDFKED